MGSPSSKCGIIPLRFLESFKDLVSSKDDYVYVTQQIFGYMLTGEFSEENLSCDACMKILIKNMIHDLKVIKEFSEKRVQSCRLNGAKGGRPKNNPDITQDNPTKPIGYSGLAKITQDNPSITKNNPSITKNNPDITQQNHVYVDVDVDVNGDVNKKKKKDTSPQKTVEETDTTFEQAKEILEYLNQKSGHAYSPVESNLRDIAARLKEKGVTVEKCKQIIDDKVLDWKGKVNGKFVGDKYLTPQTLFCKTNFWKYEGLLNTNENAPGYYLRKHQLEENYGF